MKLVSRLSLRVKISLCVAGVVLLLGIAGAIFTSEIMTTTLRTELEERGRNIATSLAARSVDNVLRANFFDLHQMIQETRSKSKDVSYVFLLDPKGNVIDHTFEAGFPTDLLSLPTPESPKEYQSQLLQTEEGFIRDLAVPVFDGKAGTLHIGMAEASLNAAVASVVRDLLIATALATVAGMALAWFLARLATRPIQQLVEVAEAVGAGDLTRRASLPSGDEVGRLGRAFDAMAEQLAARIEELQATNVQLSSLNSIAILVSKNEPMDAVLGEVLVKVLDLVRADAGGVLFGEHDRGLEYRAHRGFSKDYLEGVADLMLDKGKSEHVLDLGEYPSVEFNPVDKSLLYWIEREGLKAFVSTPFEQEREMLGALHVARRTPMPFSPKEKGLLSSVAAQMGVMLTNRQLLREASQAEALRQLNKMKSEFTVRASHELRTPATAIKGYIETLLRPDMELSRSEQKQLLKDMDEVGDRLNRLVQDVLNVSRLESGVLNVKKEGLAVRPLLQRITKRLGRQSSRHRLELKLDRNLGYAQGDADRLEDVLENLISNAIKFSPLGGTITVCAVNGLSPAGHRRSAKRSSSEACADDDFVKISVKDEGIGIPAEAVPKLFQQFYQVAGEDRARAGGIGMGLFICKTYIEAMGGDIWVESEESKGSTFSFTIPAMASS